MINLRRAGPAALALAIAAAAPVAAAPAELCAPYASVQVKLAPDIHTEIGASGNDHAVGCLMWQSFISLNWPVLTGSPGEPSAPLSRSGPTVWETFKPYDQVFGSRAEAPAPWASPDLSRGGPRLLATFHQTDGGGARDQQLCP